MDDHRHSMVSILSKMVPRNVSMSFYVEMCWLRVFLSATHPIKKFICYEHSSSISILIIIIVVIIISDAFNHLFYYFIVYDYPFPTHVNSFSPKYLVFFLFAIAFFHLRLSGRWNERRWLEKWTNKLRVCMDKLMNQGTRDDSMAWQLFMAFNPSSSCTNARYIIWFNLIVVQLLGSSENQENIFPCECFPFSFSFPLLLPSTLSSSPPPVKLDEYVDVQRCSVFTISIDALHTLRHWINCAAISQLHLLGRLAPSAPSSLWHWNCLFVCVCVFFLYVNVTTYEWK